MTDKPNSQALRQRLVDVEDRLNLIHLRRAVHELQDLGGAIATLSTPLGDFCNSVREAIKYEAAQKDTPDGKESS